MTPAQIAAIHRGEPKRKAFAALGGVSPSGYQMPQGADAIGIATYDYPIQGTGSGDAGDVNKDNYVWFQLCTNGGHVVGKDRGKMDNLPTMSC